MIGAVRIWLLVLIACGVATGCGKVLVTTSGGTVIGGDASGGTATPTGNAGPYSIGGNVSGYLGSGLVLQNVAGDDLPIAANGGFTFAPALVSGAGYAVTVLTQPINPSQLCLVTNGTNTAENGNVVNVQVTCTTNGYTVGGTVTGLNGTGLVLQDNAGDDLSVAGNGNFTFVTPVASGAPYSVTVLTQPAGSNQTCAVTNGAGKVAAVNITSVAISCVDNTYTVSGTVTGLAGSGLILQNDGGNNLAVSANGNFTFALPVQIGAAYAVSAFAQPINPGQTCTVANGTGISVADVTNVAVTCVTNTYTVGGTVTGLAGSGLVLQDNNGNNLPVSANGTFVFSSPVPVGGGYAVTVLAQPMNLPQVCTVANGTGRSTANVTNVAVVCTTLTYTVGGTVTGLFGPGLVLQNNGGNNLAVSSNGSFTFTTGVPVGGGYAVTVLTEPATPSRSCTITNGTGTILASNITNVTITCKVAVGKFVYVATADAPSGDIRGLLINANTGDLTGMAGSPYPGGNSVFAVTIDPTAQFVYGANLGSDDISIFGSDPATGALTFVGSQTTGAGSAPVSISADPSGRFFYALDNNGLAVLAFTINAATGALIPVTGSPFAVGNDPEWESIDPSGHFLYVANKGDGTISAFLIDQATGALAPVAGSPFISDVFPGALVIDPSGQRLYSADFSDGTVSLFTINQATGVLTATGVAAATGASAGPLRVNIDPSGQFFYVTDFSDGGVFAYTVNAANGGLAAIAGSPFATGIHPFATSIDPSGQYLYVSNTTNGTLTGYAIDAATGVLNALPASPYAAGTTPGSSAIR